MKKTLVSKLAPLALAAALALPTTAALAADDYKFDASHSQVLFSYNHLGFSTTYGLFSGFNGTAKLDADNIANSSVNVEMSLADMITGWDKRDEHFKSADFFNAEKFPVVTFSSTKIEATGENTAKITGDLTIAGETKEVVLDAKINKMGEHPIAKKPWAGFDASTTLKRTDFGLGKFAPFVGDEVDLKISVEMEKVS